jgi:hypothetical protein
MLIAVIVLLLGGLSSFCVQRSPPACHTSGRSTSPSSYLAHSISLRLLRDPVHAFRSQLPMLVLMVLFTITSLWNLAQPIVK